LSRLDHPRRRLLLQAAPRQLDGLGDVGIREHAASLLVKQAPQPPGRRGRGRSSASPPAVDRPPPGLKPIAVASAPAWFKGLTFGAARNAPIKP